MKKLLPFALLLPLLAGCAAKPITLPAASAPALKGKLLTPVTYPKVPTFREMTPMKAGLAGLGGAVGGLAMAAMDMSGKALVAGNAVEDPAVAIANSLAPLYAEKLGTPVAPMVKSATKGKPADLSKDVQGQGLILDVVTTNWQLIYFPVNWSHYRVLYNARARLIDAATGTVIAQSPCNFVSDDDPAKAPTYDELTGNGAALLKERLARAAAECSAVMKSTMLGAL